MNADYRAIKKFCMRHRRRYITAKVVNTWLLLAGILFTVGTASTIGFAFFPWTGLPVLFDIVAVLFIVACVGVVVHWTVIHSPSEGTVARLLEKQIDRKHQYLSIALELGGALSMGSSKLIASVCSVACESFGSYPKKITGTVYRKRVITFCITLIAVCSATYVCSPRLSNWLFIPLSMFSRVSASVYPGTIVVPKHTGVILNCVPEEPLYPSAKISVEELIPEGSRPVNHLLCPDISGSFSYAADSLVKSIVYSFTLGNTRFGPETVTVVPPPILYSLKVTLTPPVYTRRKTVQLPEGQGSITAYPGTRALFSLGSQYPLKQATYIPQTGDSVPLVIRDGKATGEVRLWRSGRYTFILEDSMSQTSDSLPLFFISMLPDYEPNVRFLKPGANKLLTPALQETLWVEAVDDFGIRQLTLHWKKSADDPDTVYSRKILPKGKTRKLVRRKLAWDLTELSLYPGDTVFYWARTRDTKPFGKLQVCVTDTFFFRLPTFAEIHKRIAGREEDASNTLSTVQKKQKEMKKRLESLIKSSKGSKSLSWEEKKIVEDLGKSMQEQADSLDKAVKTLQDAVEKMKESDVSSDILDKMDEVQKTLRDLIKEYGDSLFFEKPKENETLSWRDMQRTIEKMADMLPDLQERLDNALQYLEMLKKDNERALLARQAQKLAEEQMQIAQSKEDRKNRMRMEKELMQRTKDFLADAEDKLTDEQSPVGVKDVPSMDQVSAMNRSMQKQLNSKEMPENSAMNQMSAALQSMSEELNATLSSTMAAKMMKDMETLLGMAQDALHMARWQEELANSTQGKINKKMTASEQQALRDALRKSMKKLDSLTMVPPSLLQDIMSKSEDALSSMNSALQSIDGRRPGSGMKQSTHGLNALAGALLESANGMQQSGSGGGGSGGMMCGLRKLSAKQAAINSATAEMLRQMFSQSAKEGGEGKQMGQNTDGARKAARNAQKQLADQLNQLGEKYGKNSDKSMNKRVKEMEEEARRIARMMEKPTPQVSDRQDRFLVRMLEATMSLHKQDEGKEERKSKSAVTIFSDHSIEGYQGQLNKTDTFYNLRLKALDGNFPDSYRQQVQKYFDALGELFLKP